MFILQKINKKTCSAVIISLLLILLVIIKLVSCSSVSSNAVCVSIGEYSLEARNNAQRIEFLEQFGWKILLEPVEIVEILIPQKFNATYKAYNEIQQKQGLDLEKFKGKSCKRVTYKVINYPNEENVVANMLIYKDRVIGGDICSRNIDGFMQGFEKQ